MKKVVLIVAGGKGERMRAKVPKQFLLLKKIPVLMHTIKQFSHLDKIVLVLPKSKFNYWKNLCAKYNFNENHILVKGGNNRFESVKNGLSKIEDNSTIAIHDGVRPLISKKLINTVFANAVTGTGVIPIIPINDSLRKVENNMSCIIDRKKIYKIQTPQCFKSIEIKKAYTQNYSVEFTDDASVFEKHGGAIKLIDGEEKNLKITTRLDIKLAEQILK